MLERSILLTATVLLCSTAQASPTALCTHPARYVLWMETTATTAKLTWQALPDATPTTILTGFEVPPGVAVQRHVDGNGAVYSNVWEAAPFETPASLTLRPIQPATIQIAASAACSTTVQLAGGWRVFLPGVRHG